MTNNEINRMIAEQVLDSKEPPAVEEDLEYEGPDETPGWRLSGDRYGNLEWNPKDFSENMSDAWLVVERLSSRSKRDEGWDILLVIKPYPQMDGMASGYRVSAQDMYGNERFYVTDESAPKAICSAALKAYGLME